MDAKKEPAPHHQDRPSPLTTSATDSSPGTSLQWVPCVWRSAQDVVSQLARRREAAARSVPLDCGCRDSWVCRCTEPPLSDHALDGWRSAALAILATGKTPLLPLEVRRSLWRRNHGDDRALAEMLHNATAGEVA